MASNAKMALSWYVLLVHMYIAVPHYKAGHEICFLICIANRVQGVEKTIVSKMLEKGSSRRTFAVDRHAGVVQYHLSPSLFAETPFEVPACRRTCVLPIGTGCCVQAVAGIVADGRQVVNRACEESRSYKR